MPHIYCKQLLVVSNSTFVYLLLCTTLYSAQTKLSANKNLVQWWLAKTCWRNSRCILDWFSYHRYIDTNRVMFRNWRSLDGGPPSEKSRPDRAASKSTSSVSRRRVSEVCGKQISWNHHSIRCRQLWTLNTSVYQKSLLLNMLLLGCSSIFKVPIPLLQTFPLCNHDGKNAAKKHL